eukprot:2041564-Pyramimonas_sp.AAC.1
MLYRGVAYLGAAKTLEYYLTTIQHLDANFSEKVAPWIALAVFFLGSVVLERKKLKGTLSASDRMFGRLLASFCSARAAAARKPARKPTFSARANPNMKYRFAEKADVPKPAV